MKIMNNFSRFLASGLGSGYLPGVPGTWGSLSYIALWWVAIAMVGLNQLTLIGIVLAIGIISTSNCIKSLLEKEKHPDPGYIVIDEWVGMGISLINVPPTNYVVIFIAFVLFRLFDIVKPGPIRAVEGLPGALGIMADDIVAGLVVTFIVHFFIF